MAYLEAPTAPVASGHPMIATKDALRPAVQTTVAKIDIVAKISATIIAHVGVQLVMSAAILLTFGTCMITGPAPTAVLPITTHQPQEATHA